jgi:hypothetical protein
MKKMSAIPNIITQELGSLDFPQIIAFNKDTNMSSF